MKSLFTKPSLLLSIIIVVAFVIIGKTVADRRPPLEPELSTSTTEAVLPDYSVTSSDAVHYEDELVGEIAKKIFRCDDNKYFTLRYENDKTKLGHAEIFLSDYSKLYLASTVTASADDRRYANAGETLVLMTDGDWNRAEISEEGGLPEGEKTMKALVRTHANCLAQ